MKQHLLNIMITAAIVALSLPPVARCEDPPPSDDVTATQKLYLFFETLERIQDFYVEPMTTEELIDLAIAGMMDGLDDHSRFMDTDAYESLRSVTQGTFCGIGVVVAIRGECPTIVSLIDHAPAGQAGIRPGDRIVAVDSVVTRDSGLDDVVKLLRGVPGTEVELTIERGDSNAQVRVPVVREKIEVTSVIGPLHFTDDIAYIRISRFTESTGHDFAAALDQVRSGPASALILDLRGNPGGLLSQAVQVADIFVDPGEVIVEVRSRTPTDNRVFHASSRPKWTAPLVVMVDGGSASAAEIVAGAVQDHERGILVGARTFGKGTVQSIFSLESEHAVKLTTAAYYTPHGRSVEMLPDVTPSGESPAASDSACGILPDLTVQASDLDSLALSLINAGLISDFVTHHRALVALDLSAPLGDDYIRQFRDYVTSRGDLEVPYDGSEAIELAIRETIAMELGGEEAALRVRLTRDRQFLKACEALVMARDTVAAADGLIGSH